MKKVLLSLAVAFIASASINAQTAQARPAAVAPTAQNQRAALSADDKAKRRTDRLTAVCGLSAEQAANIQRINVDYYTKREQLRGATDKQSTAELTKSRNEREEKVLTPEQLTKLRAAKEQQKQNNGNKPDGAGHEE